MRRKFRVSEEVMKRINAFSRSVSEQEPVEEKTATAASSAEKPAAQPAEKSETAVPAQDKARAEAAAANAPETEKTPQAKNAPQAENREPAETAGPVALRTDVGLVRPMNEDVVFYKPDDGVLGVADGMGGHQSGEIASAGARDLVCAFLKGKTPSENLLRTAVQAANRRLYMQQQEKPELNGMGTTLTLLWQAEDRVLVGHVGDSRAYRMRDGELRQVTQDHSMVAEMVRSGMLTRAQAAVHPMRNYITRAVGTESGVDVDLIEEKRRKGDVWLICSDGLHGQVSDERLRAVLADVRTREDLAKAADSLLTDALQAGGKDNISLALWLDEGVAE